MYVCMYVCMYACMYVCMHVCMHVCMYVCMWVYVCMYVCMHACVLVYMCVWMCVCVYVYVCGRMYVAMYVGMYACLGFVLVCEVICLSVGLFVCLSVSRKSYIGTNVRMYVCMYVSMYICIPVCKKVCTYDTHVCVVCVPVDIRRIQLSASLLYIMHLHMVLFSGSCLFLILEACFPMQMHAASCCYSCRVSTCVQKYRCSTELSPQQWYFVGNSQGTQHEPLYWAQPTLKQVGLGSLEVLLL